MLSRLVAYKRVFLATCSNHHPTQMCSIMPSKRAEIEDYAIENSNLVMLLHESVLVSRFLIVSMQEDLQLVNHLKLFLPRPVAVTIQNSVVLARNPKFCPTVKLDS